jgi:predicted  nucleic acid-binding Zn-ribbon protein
VTTQLLITKEEMMELEIFVKWIKQKDKKPSHDSTKITRQLQAQWKEAKRGHITSYVEYKCLERELKATKEENGDLSKELVEMKSQFHGKGRKISQRYAKTWKVAWRRTT